MSIETLMPVPREEPAVPNIPNDRMVVNWWSVEKLSQGKNDPRRYSARDIKRAEGIISRFGLRVPLVVTASGSVLAGYLLVIVARKLGIEQLPALPADDLSEPEQQALSVALNRFYELGQFDKPLLGALLLDLEIKMPDMSFDSMGLEQPEVDLAIASVGGQKVGDEPEITVWGPPVSQRGDIWLLGDHKIGCGDATDLSFYPDLMGGAAAEMVFTDPPYGCRVAGFVTSRKHREFVQASGEMNGEQLTSFFRSWCEALASSAARGALVYLCIDWRSLHALLNAARPVFGELLNLAVWAKDRAGMGSFLRSQHEIVLIYAVPGGKTRNNVELGRHGRHRSNVWNYPSAKTFGQQGTEGDLLADHPTPKPKELVADAILDCTKRGSIILDPFLGSGSTLIAAEKTGRVCYGMDLDPLYVDLAVRRWQSWTGRQAVNSLSGEFFDAIEAGISQDG